jgi:ribosomal protein S11
VYAFDGTNYTGYSKTTDSNGQAVFTLPAGNYRFRADRNGTQFWSGASNHCAVPGCTAAAVTVTNLLTVSVQDTGGQPEAGVRVYAFTDSTYTGYSATTDAGGQAVLTLPQGSYRFRADFNGTQFWSGTGNHCIVPGCVGASITVTGPVVVTVLDTDGVARAGIRVYAFTGTTYTGYGGTTDAGGQAVFTLPQGSYRFRADLNGAQFWSDAQNHCAIPGCDSALVTVTIPVIVTVLDTSGAPRAGIRVYAFNGSTYTGYSGTTDASGQAVFTLLQGSYRFRADFNGTQFWSSANNHCSLPGCTSATVTVTSPLIITIQDTDGVAQPGLSVYAFNGPTYTGYSKITDANGQASFTLPAGNYRFRADRNGTQFWSGASNHCTVPGCTDAAITVTIPLTVTVQDTNGFALSGIPVYAFDGAVYTGYSKITDANGQATFTLPVGNYRFRADRNGTQFWSGAGNHCAVPGCTSASINTIP